MVLEINQNTIYRNLNIRTRMLGNLEYLPISIDNFRVFNFLLNSPANKCMSHVQLVFHERCFLGYSRLQAIEYSSQLHRNVQRTEILSSWSAEVGQRQGKNDTMSSLENSHRPSIPAPSFISGQTEGYAPASWVYRDMHSIIFPFYWFLGHKKTIFWVIKIHNHM